MIKIVILSFLGILIWPAILNARQIEVCGSCTISTIKEAVGLAKSGDQILLKKGIYKEYDILITKSLDISGEPGAVVDGDKKGTIFNLKAANIKLDGLKIINVGQSYTHDHTAIYLYEADHFIISNNFIENTFFGIKVERSAHGLIEKNVVMGSNLSEASSGNGIHAWHSNHIEIKNNTVYGMRDGIYFEFVQDSLIKQNISRDNLRYGLHFMFSHNNSYTDNIFSNNGAGVAVMFSKFLLMKNNVFNLNWGTASYGLLLKEIYDAEIIGNKFNENTIAINIEGSTRINYFNNTFNANGWAIKVTGACYQNIFKKNDFFGNAFEASYNSNINDNLFEENYWSSYTGYDLNKDGFGDVPHRPVKLFSYVVNQSPEAIILLRSLFVDIINFSEKVSPIFTPDNIQDNRPSMKAIND